MDIKKIYLVITSFSIIVSFSLLIWACNEEREDPGNLHDQKTEDHTVLSAPASPHVFDVYQIGFYDTQGVFDRVTEARVTAFYRTIELLPANATIDSYEVQTYTDANSGATRYRLRTVATDGGSTIKIGMGLNPDPGVPGNYLMDQSICKCESAGCGSQDPGCEVKKGDGCDCSDCVHTCKKTHTVIKDTDGGFGSLM